MGVTTYLHITPNRHRSRFHQMDRPRLAFAIQQRPGEDPMASTNLLEVFLLEPRPTLTPVTATTPMPDHTEDTSIHLGKGALAHRPTMVHRPAFDLLVQTLNQHTHAVAVTSLDCFLHLPQKRPHTTTRRFG